MGVQDDGVSPPAVAVELPDAHVEVVVGVDHLATGEFEFGLAAPGNARFCHCRRVGPRVVKSRDTGREVTTPRR